MLKRILAVSAMLAHGSGVINAFRYSDVIVRGADKIHQEWNDKNKAPHPVSLHQYVVEIPWTEACSYTAWEWCKDYHAQKLREERDHQ